MSETQKGAFSTSFYGKDTAHGIRFSSHVQLYNFGRLKLLLNVLLPKYFATKVFLKNPYVTQGRIKCVMYLSLIHI